MDIERSGMRTSSLLSHLRLVEPLRISRLHGRHCFWFRRVLCRCCVSHRVCGICWRLCSFLAQPPAELCQCVALAQLLVARHAVQASSSWQRSAGQAATVKLQHQDWTR